MGLSRCSVDGHGIVSSHRAVMGLSHGHEMPSSVSCSHGMILLCISEFFFRYSRVVLVVLGVMWNRTIVVSLSLGMVRSYTIAVLGYAMRINICLIRMDFMLKMALLFRLKYTVLILGLSHDRHHRSRFIVLTWM